eukprot:TRINITY_DN1682_c0_g1_i1.p1 TRINITY_DN1682_c0_g1~~TRINITY_DN1682_c0_g1_i1.p1  ORF type:complete len:705 (+),score=264.99 TRINITY_DN1682_c0_g1_i1:29-2116(+)
MAKKKNPEEFQDEEGSTTDYGEMPSFDDPEDFVDDISDEELMGDILKTKPSATDGVDSVIVVDGVPVVGQERLEKLKNVIRKAFVKFGNLVNEHYPVDEEGKTKGYIFLEFANASSAEQAVLSMNNYKLDRVHTFLVNLFSDFEKFEGIKEDWEEPEPRPFDDKGNLRDWLLEPDSIDQYSVIHGGGNVVSIYANTLPEPLELQSREKWTETYVQWSPMGTYLATLHSRGIAIWGGKNFDRIQRLSHVGAEIVDFSPRENYLVTFSPRAMNADEPLAIIIWDTKTGEKKRSFFAENPPVVPAFKWSYDDKFFARMSKDGTLSVFETPSFGLLDKKSIKVPGMRDFSWSPKENILAYWVAEDKDVPARVVLLEIPSRKEIRVKNLFSVADCKMHWQNAGGYLCVKVDRYKKLLKDEKDVKYAGMYYNFEIFHMLEKQIPVDSVEIKETVHAFSWEPVGSKFAVIHGDSQSLNVSFYGLKEGHTPVLLKKYERKSANHIFWSPTGQFVVLAGLRSMNGQFEFIDTSDFTTMSSNGEHTMANDVLWDPTGRYVVTGVSWWATKVDNAYWIWSFQGKLLKRVNVDKYCSLSWRPRPPTLLSKEQIKDVKKNLKKYSDTFSLKDRQKLSKASKELMDKRRDLMDKFMEYRKQMQEKYSAMKQERITLRDGIDTDNIKESEMEEEVVEFLVKEEQTNIEED